MSVGRPIARVVLPDGKIDADALQRTLDDLAARLASTQAPRGLAPASVTAGSFDPTARGLPGTPGAMHVSTAEDSVRVFVKTGPADTDWDYLQTTLVTSVGQLASGCTGNDLTLTGSLTLRSGLTGSSGYLSGSLHVQQGVTVRGSVTGSSAYFSGSMAVANSMVVSSHTEIGGDLYVEGGFTLLEDANIAGALTGSSATFSSETKFQGTTEVSGNVNLNRSGANLLGSVNNWDPGDTVIFRVTSGVGAVSITGLRAGGDGEQHIIINADSADTITLVNQSASSTDVNRFLSSTGADIALAVGDAAMTIYDITTQRHRLFRLGD